MSLRSALAGLFRRLGAARSGVVLVEFAIALPILMLMYVGVYAISDEENCNRKVTITAREITDLVTRNGSLSTAQLATLMSYVTQTMNPYSAAKVTMRVSEIQVTGATTATVVWSQGQNATALNVGDPVTIPSGVANTNAYLIYGEASYAYTPVIGLGAPQTTTLSDRYLMSPRIAGSIPLTP